VRFVDSHAHLDGDAFRDIDPFLDRARLAGITDIVCVGASAGYESNERTVALVSGRDGLFATAGIHPHDARVSSPEVVEKIRELARRPKVVAIGEIGLDYHYDLSPRAVQREVFARFLDVAREIGLPVVVHTREAEDDTIAILEDRGAGAIGGVIHCFTGTEKLAGAALRLGFSISFAGVLTFRSADALRDIARSLPRDRVLVETDCPYLAPVPMRGRTNEPSFIMHTAAELARLWDVGVDEVKRMTGENAARLFRLPDRPSGPALCPSSPT
jgi:TatD DNase family protein